MQPSETKNQTEESVVPAKSSSSEPSMSELLASVVDETEKREILRQEIERRQFNYNYRVATMLSKAGYFNDGGYPPNALTVEQAMAKIEIGRSWNLSQSDAVRYVYIVNGKPCVEEAIYAERLQAAGWSWVPQFIGGQGPKCKGVRLWIEKDGAEYLRSKRNEKGEVERDKNGDAVMEQVFVEFTEEMAEQIKVHVKGGETISLLKKRGPWSDGFRQDMFFWRALSRFRKYHAPGILNGSMLREEAQDIGPIEDLTVVEGPPRKRTRSHIIDQANAAMGKQSEYKPEDAHQDAVQETVQGTSRSDADKTTIAAELPSKAESKPHDAHQDAVQETVLQPLPLLTWRQDTPQPATIRAIEKFEATLTSKIFFEQLAFMDYKSVSDIATEKDAQSVLGILKQVKRNG